MTRNTKTIARIAIVIIALITVAAVVATLLSGPSADAFATLSSTRKAILIAAMGTVLVPVWIAMTLRHSTTMVVSAIASVVLIVAAAVGVFVV